VTDGVQAFGGIDILYNNASQPRMGLFTKLPPEDWNFTIQNELDVVYYVTLAAWPHLVERGGSIINTSSVAAVRGVPGFEQSAHAAAKAGVMGLTTALVSEGGPHRIRVNTITPGPIRHPLIEPVLGDPENAFARMVARIPLGRIGEPEDVAQLALFLASDESSFITGANIVIDGGLSSFM
jgi:meso-butanediol dehydrogenase/(S,S)-butanediol dehydrogenase/diacetyl reductase